MSDTRTIDLEPRFADGDPMRLIGLCQRYEAMAGERIQEQWARLQGRLGEVRGRSDPAQFGLLYQISERPFIVDYMTGVMVDEDAPPPSGLVERRLPARRHAVFTHRGEPSGLRPLIHAIFCEWLPQSGHAAAGNPDFVEVYGQDSIRSALRA